MPMMSGGWPDTSMYMGFSVYEADAVEDEDVEVGGNKVVDGGGFCG